MRSTPRSAPARRTRTRAAVVRRVAAVATKNGRVEAVTDLETEGIGVRVLVGGAWGFACDRPARRRGRARRGAARLRVRARRRRRRAAALAPLDAADRHVPTPVENDPFAISLAEKIDLCLRAEEALARPGRQGRRGVRRARSASARCSSPPTAPTIEQELVESGGGIDALAVGDGASRCAATRARTAARARRRGWEYVRPRARARGAARRRAGGCAPAAPSVPPA